MNESKLKYSLLILALGLAIGFALAFWYTPDNGYIPENDKAGLGTAVLPEEYKYNLDQYKQVDPKLVLYKEVEGFKTGFEEATGIVIDNKGKIYICGDKGIRIFDSKGSLISEKNTAKKVTAIAVSKEGDVFVALQHILSFQSEDSLRTFGNRGKGPGQLEYITSMKFLNNQLFIADAGNRRVSVFDFNKKIFREFGKNDSKKGVKGFVIPSPHMDLVADKDGSVWVANTGRLRVEKYSKDGILLSSWGKAGSKLEEFIGCCNPCNFTITTDGSFITSEKGLPRIKEYDKTGKFVGVVAPPSAFSEKCVNMAVAVDSIGRVYALDSINKSVRVFEKK